MSISLHFPKKVNDQLWLAPISKIFVSILYFDEYDEVIYGIADHFQQLGNKNTQDIFCKIM